MTQQEQERQAIEKAAEEYATSKSSADIFIEAHKADFKAGAEFALSELHKPSEDLVQEIEDIVESNTWKKFNTDGSGKIDFDILSIATEIAKLIPFQQNDVNVELLDTLKMIRDDINAGEPASEEFLEHIKTLADSAITNAETQILANSSQTCKDWQNNAIQMIADERKRQIEVKMWTPEHDDYHRNGELANAAAYYSMTDDLIDFMDVSWGNDMHLNIWPFDVSYLKRTPDNRIRELVKAGALIAAEIERLTRVEKQMKQ